MRIKITILLLLCIAVFQSSFAQADNEDEPAPLRKTGCSNPKFIAAEKQAYQELLAERARIDKWREDTITRIEWVKRDELDRANRRYSAALKDCKDTASCSENAKVKYDDDVTIALAFRDKCLKIVRRMAAEKYHDAQDVYDKAVDEAIRLYCPSYKATGETANVAYSGTICSLEKPFTVTGTIASVGIEYPFKFIPTPGNTNTGTFSFYTKWKMAVLEGSGTYTIEGKETGKPRILMKADSKGIIPQATVTGGGDAGIELVPLGTNECDGK